MKKILFIATGGTIACERTAEGLAPKLGSADLLRHVPSLAELCEIDAVQPFSLDSTNMSPNEWIAVAELISSSYAEYDGFVISHGTDTLGYGAAALSCMIQGSGKPIILTGSQKPIDASLTDAKSNLYDAFNVAVDGRLGGVAVVFGGRIIDGRCAVKCHTRRLDAFRSIDRLQLGHVGYEGMVLDAEGSAEFTAHDGAPLFLCRMNTAVSVIKLIPAMDTAILDCAAERSRVLIIEGFGMGGFPDYGKAEFEQKIAELVMNGVIIIMTTQVMEGGCDMSVYEVGKSVAERYHIIEAKGMTTEYASMRAMWSLAYASSTEDFKELFLR